MKTLALTLAFCAAAFAANIQVLPVETGSADIDDRSAQMLVRSAVKSSGHNVAETSNEQLQVSFMTMGSAVVVVGEYSKDGEVVASSKLKAERVEDLDIAVLRVVGAVLEDSSPQENEEVGQLTKHDQVAIVERRRSRSYNTFGFGPGIWHNMEDDGEFDYAFRYGRIWEVGLSGAITLTSYTSFSTGTFQLHEALLIGGRYMFSPSSFSPYVGAGLGFGYSYDTHEDDYGDEYGSAYGFAWNAGAGVVLFRTSDIQLDLGVNYDMIIGESGVGAFYIAVNW